jgi:hypothetical protein
MRDVKNIEMRTLASKRWRSSSLIVKVAELDELIEFIVRNCPKRITTLHVELSSTELARIAVQHETRWMYSSSSYPQFVFELTRAKT